MTPTLPHPILQALIGDAEVGAYFSNEADLAAMLRVESALAEAEAKVGLIDGETARRIAESCRAFQADWSGLSEGLARDGVIVPEFVRQLRGAVGEPHARSVHLGATSQDIIDTGLILRLKGVIEILGRRLDALIHALDALKRRDGATRLMAHTRMQQALPFSAADKIDTWLQPLDRLREQLQDLAPRLLVVQLGGPIGTRGELKGQGDAIADAMAEILELGLAPSWHSQRDRIGEFGAFLSLITGTLGKIGQDIALMAQNEVGEVRLATGGGSSAMPHKSNPVPAEVLVTLARFNAGMLGTLHQALVHEGERSGAAWTLEWMVLPQMAVSAASALSKAHGLMAAMSFAPSKAAGP
ncbi:3-carboxy-cis,cis-muconate cycloisomerase [Microvirga lotononidis]|uniref:3-carboxy-cis,cis-muconate cycloisomerase n=1 Tax=Microvirga lotononidis TaxID=864069 RepID=I4Z0M5_9HYPH|nr:3-carboxy-cis,cis-muconate cycloisomerase [Microvirga lotononidis]EIM29767.1 3-carboxy-cis,cis-muconate cycloisomerase [Microvirga lotononidis]WQO26934.1 3-carboxy-cis,cis-muconate cycloisomerase [Microvirga lotononidis]